jgi:RNA polymerase sigma factor (sigma-70 family)
MSCPDTLLRMSGAAAGKGFFGGDATIWSTILKARDGEDQTRIAALGRLLERYRLPVQCEIRWQRGCSVDEAEELTSEFTAACLRRDFLKHVSPDQGRFRTFLKHCIRNFLRDIHVEETAQKRGGGQTPLSLDLRDPDGSRLIDPSDVRESPDSQMDREWALTVLENALNRLKADCEATRRRALFETLRPTLSGGVDAAPLAELAKGLGMSKGAVKVAAHRLRQRLGELIEEEIRQTIADGGDWRDELRYLVELLGR